MSVYKQPIVVPNADISYQTDPNNMSAMESTSNNIPARRMSGGNPASKQMNMHGETKIRGTGAATKGTKARGPMA
jgi:hypothetical protein